MFSASAVTLSALLPFLISASPVPAASTLPACSDRNVPCQCPAGATFSNYTTTGTIASTVNNVYSVAGDFYKTEWFGLPLTKTQGPDNVVGSVRTLTVAAEGASYLLQEKITSINRNYLTGSFNYAYEQANVGVTVPPALGGGAYNGYWPAFFATPHQFNPLQTDIVWTCYICETGDPLDPATLHESAMANISTILQSEGKLYGQSTKPVSVKTG